MAIRGERFDGHDFVGEAVNRGASTVIVERRVAVASPLDVLVVPDTELYLAEQARSKLESIRPTVVAITGSVGKTSTKNAIATVLRAQFPVLSTSGNLNTVLGVALTLLNGDFGAGHVVILEMGACRAGDIAQLCSYFRPDIAVVTNVRGVHLDTFGTIEDVARAKGEIVEALGPSGTAVLNADDVRVRAMADRCSGAVLYYGTGDGAGVTPKHITEPLPLLGDHVVNLALSAYAVGKVLGMASDVINEQFRKLSPEKGRLNRLPGLNGSTLIDDSYNASPDAVHSALAVMQREVGAAKIACLGDMLELGAPSHDAHMSVIVRARQATDVLVLVGERMAQAHKSLPPDPSLQTVLCRNSAEAAALFGHGNCLSVQSGDVVLVKGSQGIRMERVSAALLDERIAPESVLCRQSESWRQIA